MKRETLTKVINEINGERLSLLEAKGHDYANEDVLANGTRMSELSFILGIDPSNSACDCFLFLALLKIDRWCNLRQQGKSPKNESIRDTLLDLHNYIDLAYGAELDSTGEPVLTKEEMAQVEEDAFLDSLD